MFGLTGTDYEKVRGDFRRVTDPYSGNEIFVVPAIRPDWAVIHAIRADENGNVVCSALEAERLALLSARHPRRPRAGGRAGGTRGEAGDGDRGGGRSRGETARPSRGDLSVRPAHRPGRRGPPRGPPRGLRPYVRNRPRPRGGVPRGGKDRRRVPPGSFPG